MTEQGMTGWIRAAFKNIAITCREETDLQKAAAAQLTKHGVPFTEQARLHSPLGDKVGVIDFLCRDVGLELKTKGSLSSLLRQLDRYAESPQVRELIVLTTRRSLCRLPPELRGKPISSIIVGSL